MKESSSFQFFYLNNGIPIICINDIYKHSVMISWMVNVGSIFDPINKLGLAHFIEHMFYKGTKSKPSPIQLNLSLNKYGAYSNAHTSQERTWYDIHIDSKYWHKGVETMSEMMYESLFPEEEIEPEKKVVIQEVMLKTMTAQDVLIQDSSAWIWSGTPFARSIGGNQETINNINSNDIVRFLGEYYQPNRMLILVVGNLPSTRKTEKVIRSYFDKPWNHTLLGKARDSLAFIGQVPIFKTYLREPYWWPHLNTKNLKNTEHNYVSNRIGETPYILNGTIEHPTYPGPSIQWIPYAMSNSFFIRFDFPVHNTNDERVVNLCAWLNAYLTEGMGSSLFVELREKQGLIYSVHSKLDSASNIGVGTYTITTSLNGGEEELLKIIKIIHNELLKLKNKTTPRNIVKFYRQMAQGKKKLSLDNPYLWINQIAESFFVEGVIPGQIEKRNPWEFTQPKLMKKILNNWFHNQTTWITIVAPKNVKNKKIITQKILNIVK